MFELSGIRGDMLPAATATDWKALAEQLLIQMQEISDSLRISEDEQACASGNSAIISAIADLQSQAKRIGDRVRRDFALLPINPSPAMLDGAVDAIKASVNPDGHYVGVNRETADRAWMAMLEVWQRSLT